MKKNSTALKAQKPFLLSLAFLIFFACKKSEGQTDDLARNFSIDYEKYELENGLDVILHEDKSDPIVAIAVEIHAGSNREKPGRTGFAHFFEHMLFKKSENVPEGYFWNKIPEWGGTFNGTTNKDRTLYYETVPKNALEKLLWMEADRLGYFINAVDPKGFETEKQVVKNEKRYRVDNVPYGHQDYATIKALYPEEHPYNWTTIGEFEDLQNATLDDVKEFYDLWYGPQNATIVIAGDFDKEQTKKWIEKYFGEIKPHGQVIETKAMPANLENTIALYHEDSFAKLPQLTLTFPSVEDYHADYWALNTLAQILSDGKGSSLYKQVVLKDKLASDIYAYNYSQEIAGRFIIGANANEGVDLDALKKSIDRALMNFEAKGVSDRELNRVKAALETEFYNGIASVQGKSFQLAHYNTFLNDPGFIEIDIGNIQKVTADQVLEVYKKYIKDKPYVATSFVPKGQVELALKDSKKAKIKEESQEPYVPKEVQDSELTYEKTPSKIDRTKEPDFGPEPVVRSPEIWTESLVNGARVMGITANELPMVNFSVRIKGGMQLDDPAKVGVANLVAELMMEGTKNKTPEELENTIKDLGANIDITASAEYTTLTATCLSRNFNEVVAIVEEMLLEPRWDPTEFDRIKEETLTSIKQRDADPNAVASMVRNKLLYGTNIMGNHVLGTEESLNKVTLDDLISFYDDNYSPTISTFHIAGDINQEAALSALKSFGERWKMKEVALPRVSSNENDINGKIYFVDIPDSKQSQLNIARLTVDGNSGAYLPIYIANYQLGSGSHGYLNKKLRIEKGYTYGAISVPQKRISKSQLFVWTAVKSDVTKESIQAYLEVVDKYRNGYGANDLEVTKNSLLREAAREYETLNDLLGILHNISSYELPLNYIDHQQSTIKNSSLEKTKELIEEYIDPNEVVYIVVGDKATQFGRLKGLGMGAPILLDKYGERVNENEQ